MAFRFDIPCLIVAGLFTLSHVLTLIVIGHIRGGSNNFDIQAWKELDGAFIQQEQAYQRKVWALEVTTGILNSLGWVVFAIPMIQIAWLLSLGGQRNLSSHIAIAVLALGGSFMEIVARVMTIGATSAIHWLSSGFFNLDHWTGKDSGDLMGWRTLEVISVVINGLTTWVDSLEWLFLSAILFLIFLSVASKKDSAWSMRWAILGVFIGVLSFVDFSFNVMRFKYWRTFSALSFLVTSVTRLILMPVWLVWLSRILYTVQATQKASSPVTSRGGDTELT